MNSDSYPKENYELSPLCLSTINSARRNSQCKPAIVLIQADVHWIYGNVLTPLLLTNVILEINFAKKSWLRVEWKFTVLLSLSPWWTVKVACWKTYQWARRRQTASQVEVTSPGVSRSFFFITERKRWNLAKRNTNARVERERWDQREKCSGWRRSQHGTWKKTSFTSLPYAFMILLYSKMTHITGRQKRKTNLCKCNS